MTDTPLDAPRPTDLDAVFKRDPKSVTRDERRALVVRARDDRARWLEKAEKRAAKKEEKEDADE